jgi:hypothetical protein
MLILIRHNNVEAFDEFLIFFGGHVQKGALTIGDFNILQNEAIPLMNYFIQFLPISD